MEDERLKTGASFYAILSAVKPDWSYKNDQEYLAFRRGDARRRRLRRTRLHRPREGAGSPRPRRRGALHGEGEGRQGGHGRLPRRFDHRDERLAQSHHGLAPRHLPAGEVQGDPRRHRRNRLEPRRVPRGARRAPAQPRPALRGVRHQRRRRAAPGHLALHGGHRAPDVEEGPCHGHRVHLHDHPRHEAGLPRRQLQPRRERHGAARRPLRHPLHLLRPARDRRRQGRHARDEGFRTARGQDPLRAGRRASRPSRTQVLPRLDRQRLHADEGHAPRGPRRRPAHAVRRRQP